MQKKKEKIKEKMCVKACMVIKKKEGRYDTVV